jgi:prepilin-type N-terminal cleavage/methylation domain-containing protein
MRASRRRRAGFTLIEVLLAVALMLAISAGMLSYIWGLLASRERLVAATDQQISAAALFDQIESDLSTTFAVDGSGAAGVEGRADSLVVRSRGVGALGGEGVSDLGDQQGCEVRFDAGAHMLTARRLGRGEAGFETLASPVSLVRFRYFDGKVWTESFDSAAAGGLPGAVVAAVWFEGGVEERAGEERPSRGPDRVRVMVIPDGPAAEWKSRL